MNKTKGLERITINLFRDANIRILKLLKVPLN